MHGTKRSLATLALAVGLAAAGLLASTDRASAAGPQVDREEAASTAPAAWPSLKEQLAHDRVLAGTPLAKLIARNQDFGLLRPQESRDSLRIPLWLRVLYRKNHPEEQARPGDPTGGYPFVLKEVAEWMLTHQDLLPGKVERAGLATRAASETGEERISGAQTSPRSESDIRINYFNPSKIIGASNNISATGRQAMFFSSNGGATWGQTLLPLNSGDSFQSDPTVEWTSDGTAWSTTIGINAAGTILQMRSYKSTDGGATWTFDATFSTGSNNDKQMIWVDHSATSPFKDNLYAIWHNGNPAFVNRRTGPGGSWQSPVQVSGAETTGTAIGDDVKTNANGDVFGFFPDTGSRRLNLVKSTNGGVSFGAPVRIATTFASFEYAIPSNASRQPLLYISGGAYRTGTKNNVYATWNDLSGDAGCTSGSGPGTNAASTCKSRIWFARSTDGGATWAAAVKLNNQAGLNDQFFPWMTVDETNGKVAIVYYDTVGDSTRKTTNVYYQSSTDDGATWSAPFKVTTASTNETTAGADSGNQYGDYIGLSGFNGTFFPSWTDRRNNASEEIWTANIADSTTATPDFAISASPTAVTVVQGNAGTSTITTTVSGGFNSAVSLSASGQPSGVTVGFSPASIAAPGAGSSTMTMTVASTVATGTYTITVTGTGAAITHTATVSLTVTTGGVTQLLGNPGFENGSASPAPWTATPAVIDNSTGEPAHSGAWKAWLDGYGTTHTDSILQQVAIPSTATTATLTFWLHIDTAETTTVTAFDTLKVQIRNTSGTVLSTLATFSNLSKNTGFALKSFDVTSFKGQTVQVFLVGTEDSSLQTSFVVDDFALNVQ